MFFAPQAIPQRIAKASARASGGSFVPKQWLGKATALVGVIAVVGRLAVRSYRGHIDRAVLSRELPQPPSWTYYLSGPPRFAQSMQEQLIASGVESGSIKVESFEGYE